MTPREKIAAIFAKARSTTSPHERDNAVTLGTRLAEKAGLSLDLFDVPGRVKAKPARPTMTVHAAEGVYSDAAMTAAFMAMTEALRSQRFRSSMSAQTEAMQRATEEIRKTSDKLQELRQAQYRAGLQPKTCPICNSRITTGVRHTCPNERPSCPACGGFSSLCSVCS